MAIVAGDLVAYYTQGPGGLVDAGELGSAAVSLGGYRGSAAIATNTDNNLFDDVTGPEAVAGDTNYRCYCIRNNHATLTLYAAKIYVSTDENNADTSISIAVEVPTGNASTGPAQEIVTETTAPNIGTGNASAWVASSAANSYANGIAINVNGASADLAPGNIVFVWVKRVIGVNAWAANGINFTIRVEGQTS